MKSLSYTLVLLVCATALCQTTAPVGADHNLTLETIGHGYWKPHRPFVFRVYSTPESTKADVRSLSFHSREEANQYLRTCLKRGSKVIYKQKKKDSDGQVIGERIVAVWQESGKKEYALIRGVHLNYYFVGSSSLAAAIQVEELIEE